MKTLYIFLLIIGILLILLGAFPNLFDDIESNFANVSNFMVYIGIVIAFIAIIAPMITNLHSKPKLKLIINNSVKNPKIYIENDDIKEFSRVVTHLRSGWNIKIENNGNISAKNVWVKFTFYLGFDTTGWSGGPQSGYREETFVWGGGYKDLIWEIDDGKTIFPNSYIELPMITFDNISKVQNCKLEVTLACDDMKTKVINYDVEIIDNR